MASSAPRESIAPYLRQLGGRPQLTREQEYALARRARKGDEQARETLGFVEKVREAVDVPVVTYDERFTSSLAGGDDARAAAYLLSSYLEWLGSR